MQSNRERIRDLTAIAFQSSPSTGRIIPRRPKTLTLTEKDDNNDPKEEDSNDPSCIGAGKCEMIAPKRQLAATTATPWATDCKLVRISRRRKTIRLLAPSEVPVTQVLALAQPPLDSIVLKWLNVNPIELLLRA